MSDGVDIHIAGYNNHQLEYPYIHEMEGINIPVFRHRPCRSKISAHHCSSSCSLVRLFLHLLEAFSHFGPYCNLPKRQHAPLPKGLRHVSRTISAKDAWRSPGGQAERSSRASVLLVGPQP